MTLEELGWDNYIGENSIDNIDPVNVARVAIEYKSSYLLFSEQGDLEGVVPGKMHHEKLSGADLPKVGDFVAVRRLPGEDKAVIEKILPRKSQISRYAVAKDRGSLGQREEQVLAANVDVMFIVQGLDHDFNLSRLQRYLVLAKQSKCLPVILLNKADAAPNSETQVQQAKNLGADVPVFALSAKTGKGMEQLQEFLSIGNTIIFVGSSGVGKSTIINALFDSTLQKTQAVREEDSKGRHTTTRREMFPLPSGAIIIDTPGMRELSVVAEQESVQAAFDEVQVLMTQCRYADCDHEKSQGCAIIEAVKNGKIPLQRYESFLKLLREQQFIASQNEVESYTRRKKKEKTLSRHIRKVIKHKDKYQ